MVSSRRIEKATYESIPFRFIAGNLHPDLTTARARQLIARAIAQHSDHLLDLGAVIHYRQRRNHAAYRSHRQRTLVRHRQKT